LTGSGPWLDELYAASPSNVRTYVEDKREFYQSLEGVRDDEQE